MLFTMLFTIIKRLKDLAFNFFVIKNYDIKSEYEKYVIKNIKEHHNNRLQRWMLLIHLNYKYRIVPRVHRLFGKGAKIDGNGESGKVRYFEQAVQRKSVDEMLTVLNQYDVISFDIFDTAIYRKVEKPIDVFTIMASEMGHNDFQKVRKDAENEARALKEKSSFTREIVLSEIYDILEKYYGIDRYWMERELELELDLSQVNPYIFEVYQHLVEMGKEIIFTSDMYLPKEAIVEMLRKNGYTTYSKLYLSNEVKLRKGDGTLQKLILEDYKGKRIVHIGDSKASDVDKSIEVGLDAIYNADSRISFLEPDMDNLAGSFYRSIINTNMNNGTWDKSLYYEHGFRVGGILAAGFCEYINTLVEQKKIDKILFCSRDCEVLWKAYNQFYKKCENEYLQISRYSILNVTSERYLYDLASRYIIRYMQKYKSEKTIERILSESGFGYLADYLNDDHIDRFWFPNTIDLKRIERFVYNHKDIIVQHNASMVNAAKKYYASLLGDSKNVLVVDIGWSGTCITAFKYFVEKHFPERNYQVFGALLCASRNNAVTLSIENGDISSYVYSNLSNMDLTRYMFPGGKKLSVTESDKLHMPLEFLFTSCEGSLIGYEEREDGSIDFIKSGNTPNNTYEIQEMQSGLIDFIKIFKENTAPFEKLYTISPYVAFNPLKESIKHQQYIKAVYQNFTYDAMTAPFAHTNVISFGQLLGSSSLNQQVLDVSREKKQILFISPALTYTGAPRSLLRMCKVAIDLGYHPVVWSAKDGPLADEFAKINIKVQVVPESELQKRRVIEQIKSFDMAVCNTIETDSYARLCERYIPTVWYIREATNIPDFTRNNFRRTYTLKHSKNIYCVSQYAATAIKPFANHKVKVIHNCVEDEVDMATQYHTGSADKVRFVQFGTIEYRKGYDVLLSAFKAMPESYRESAELYFAGGFISSGAPFCSYFFSEIKDEPNVHYLGEIQGEEKKISTLSTMDVVVVASRDESCSLVALEGAMLSKPLIVTENVGAKYMVGKDNGIVVKTEDVDSLKIAMMKLIDKKDELASMGRVSREYYEKYASMDSYKKDMEKLYSLTEKKNSLAFFIEKTRNKFRYNKYRVYYEEIREQQKDAKSRKKKEDVVVSLTSHPGRINTVSLCIETLINQTSIPQKILLWLSKDQFPQLEKNLPEELIKLEKEHFIFEIRWVDNDIAPHKKYFYTMKEYPDIPVIIVDDDAFYDSNLIEKLMKSYRAFPDCISAMRANLMTFEDRQKYRAYSGWIMEYKMLLDTPSYQLVPTGVGGVLYPPKALPEEAFNYEAIMETCLYCDDLWLKVLSSHNGYRTVVPRDFCLPRIIPSTSETALWRLNVNQNNNDTSMKSILEYYDKNIGRSADWLQKIWKDRFC